MHEIDYINGFLYKNMVYIRLSIHWGISKEFFNSCILSYPVRLQSGHWHSRHNNKLREHHEKFPHQFHFVLSISVVAKIRVYMAQCNSIDSRELGSLPSCLHFGTKGKDHNTIHISLNVKSNLSIVDWLNFHKITVFR